MDSPARGALLHERLIMRLLRRVSDQGTNEGHNAVVLFGGVPELESERLGNWIGLRQLQRLLRKVSDGRTNELGHNADLLLAGFP